MSHAHAEGPIRTTAEVSFETLHQRRLVKPTHVYRYADAPGTQWWRRAVGMTHSDYYRRYRLGAVLTYLAVDVFDVPLMPQDAITVEYDGPLGRYVYSPDKPARYGGLDHLALIAEDGREAARLRSYWLWFRTPEQGRPGTIAEPPPLFPPRDEVFDPHPAAPAVTGTLATRFRWTRRETDLNQHVNSLSFLERAENAVAEAGLAVSPTGRWEIWYAKPGFEGRQVDAYVAEAATHIDVRLTDTEATHPLATLRLPKK